MERKLNEQWIEELDGKRHMLKAVPPIHLCSGCVFSNKALCSDPLMSERDIDCSKMIVKDLGILNENGCLPCPLCGGYPRLAMYDEKTNYYAYCNDCGTCIGERVYPTEQEAIDAWNKRV